jgi:hypothetical protein
MARDYKKEYRDYQGRPEQIKARSSRNKARRLMIKKHGKAKLKGKDVDHKNGNPLNNDKRNLAISSVHANRAKH